MSKLLKYLLVSSTLLLSGVTLYACGNNDEQSGNNTTDTDKVKVVIRTTGKNPEMTEIVNEFNKNNKNYFVEIDEGKGYSDVYKKNKADFATGNQPNLTYGYPDHFQEFNRLKPQVLDLNTYINDPEIGYTKEELDDFVSAYLDEGKNYTKEGTFSFTLGKSAEIAYYNKKEFEKLGLLDTLKSAKSWDDFEKLGVLIINKKEQALKAEGKTTEEVATIMKNFYPITYESDSNLIIRSIVSLGGNYTKIVTKEDGTKDGEILFNQFGETADQDQNKELQKVIKYFAELNKKGILNTKKSLQSGYLSDVFKQGNSLINIASSAGLQYNTFDKIEKGLTEARLVPQFTDSGAKAVSISQGPSVAILKNADERRNKGAWLFLKELLKPKNQFKISILKGYASVRKSTYELPEYKAWVAEQGLTSNKELLIRQVAELYKGIPVEELYLSPVFNKSAKARNLIDALLHAVYSSEEFKALTSSESDYESKVREIIKKQLKELEKQILR